ERGDIRPELGGCLDLEVPLADRQLDTARDLLEPENQLLDVLLPLQDIDRSVQSQALGSQQALGRRLVARAGRSRGATRSGRLLELLTPCSHRRARGDDRAPPDERCDSRHDGETPGSRTSPGGKSALARPGAWSREEDGPSAGSDPDYF